MWLSVLVLLGGALVATTAPARAATSCAPDPVVCPAGLYLGVTLPGLPENLAGLQAFGDLIGKHPTVVNYFNSFENPLDTTGMSALAADHRLPMVTWEPFNQNDPSANPFPLSAIASGRFDTYLRAQARRVAAMGARIAIRFAHEMNGYWYPWGRGVNGNTDAQYVAAYRHVHDVFIAAGATNVLWVWAPNIVGARGAAGMASLYPGDDYVDWVGLSGYLDSTTATFANYYPATFAELNTFAGTKPIFVAETSVQPEAARATRITELISGLMSTPRLVGLSWFDIDARRDWRLENDSNAAAAFRAAVASPWFVSAGGATTIKAAPLLQQQPSIMGVGAVGGLLTTDEGTWRTSPDSGAVLVSAQWYRCADATTIGSCAPISGAASTRYSPTPADWGRYLRSRVTAANALGSTTTWSTASASVVVRPAAPAAPTVVAYRGALKITFPAPPWGTTDWLVSVNGQALPYLPITRTSYWVSRLTSAQAYRIELAAADVTPEVTRISDARVISATPH